MVPARSAVQHERRDGRRAGDPLGDTRREDRCTRPRAASSGDEISAEGFGLQQDLVGRLTEPHHRLHGTLRGRLGRWRSSSPAGRQPLHLLVDVGHRPPVLVAPRAPAPETPAAAGPSSPISRAIAATTGTTRSLCSRASIGARIQLRHDLLSSPLRRGHHGEGFSIGNAQNPPGEELPSNEDSKTLERSVAGDASCLSGSRGSPGAGSSPRSRSSPSGACRRPTPEHSAAQPQRLPQRTSTTVARRPAQDAPRPARPSAPAGSAPATAARGRR